MCHFPSSCINIFVILSLMARQERNGTTVQMHLHLQSTIAKTLSTLIVGALALASLGNLSQEENNTICVTFPKEAKASLTSIAVACVLS